MLLVNRKSRAITANGFTSGRCDKFWEVDKDGSLCYQKFFVTRKHKSPLPMIVYPPKAFLPARSGSADPTTSMPVLAELPS